MSSARETPSSFARRSRGRRLIGVEIDVGSLHTPDHAPVCHHRFMLPV